MVGNMQAGNYKNYFSNMMNLQPFDMNAFKHIASQNIEALSAANQVALEGIQAIWRRNTEVMQQQAQKNVEFFKNSASCGSPEEWNKLRAKRMSNMVEELNHFNRELLDMGHKAVSEFCDIYQRHVTDNVNHMMDTANCCNPMSPQQSVK